MILLSYLSVDKGSNGHIPSSVSSHHKTKKRPNSVIVKRRNEDSGSTASAKDIRPSPLVQIVVYVIDITAKPNPSKSCEKTQTIIVLVLVRVRVRVLVKTTSHKLSAESQIQRGEKCS